VPCWLIGKVVPILLSLLGWALNNFATFADVARHHLPPAWMGHVKGPKYPRSLPCAIIPYHWCVGHVCQDHLQPLSSSSSPLLSQSQATIVPLLAGRLVATPFLLPSGGAPNELRLGRLGPHLPPLPPPAQLRQCRITRHRTRRCLLGATRSWRSWAAAASPSPAAGPRLLGQGDVRVCRAEPPWAELAWARRRLAEGGARPPVRR
jgi:hypothetical protein